MKLPTYRTHDFGSGPLPVWYHFRATFSARPGPMGREADWQPVVSCCAPGPLAAMRKMRRAFPEYTIGRQLLSLDWNPLAPLIRPELTP